ncbi:hypothetical protein NT01EI_1843 [Edwardsiella ictaluri 93-146]|uniref:Uncharacterized protein n=1 Tax=Edwardsiella ictaluri (strain 93-146) TaxID=634503 RepID=C5BGU1_EDWI9|nr:hypothetical protein NT01EI_1843 [Edwardsiella ictaluri 93-146]
MYISCWVPDLFCIYRRRRVGYRLGRQPQAIDTNINIY